jgi:hypothetical protein
MFTIGKLASRTSVSNDTAECRLVLDTCVGNVTRTS